MERFALVIFDCDGVLIDSERLAVRTEAAILAELGWPLSESEIIDRFVGRSAAHMQAEVERHIGRSLDWAVEFEPRYRDVFERELAPVHGVVEVLDSLETPSCVASSSTLDSLAFKLELVGMRERFTNRIFSCEEVANAKPAPDVFLLAAREMGVDPQRCAVVEDSVSGVQAARAAGMAVFAFSGGVTSAARLACDGVVVFAEMAALHDLPTG